MYNKGETRFKQTRADITCKKTVEVKPHFNLPSVLSCVPSCYITVFA